MFNFANFLRRLQVQCRIIQHYIKHTSSKRESYQHKTELWNPLDCLAEVTKSCKPSSQDPVIKSEFVSAHGGEDNNQTNEESATSTQLQN